MRIQSYAGLTAASVGAMRISSTGSRELDSLALLGQRTVSSRRTGIERNPTTGGASRSDQVVAVEPSTDTIAGGLRVTVRFIRIEWAGTLITIVSPREFSARGRNLT